jgi:hypothetical protein
MQKRDVPLKRYWKALVLIHSGADWSDNRSKCQQKPILFSYLSERTMILLIFTIRGDGGKNGPHGILPQFSNTKIPIMSDTTRICPR